MGRDFIVPTLYDLVYTIFEEPSHIGSRGGGGLLRGCTPTLSHFVASYDKPGVRGHTPTRILMGQLGNEIPLRK